jgi:hypothetical protein
MKDKARTVIGKPLPKRPVEKAKTVIGKPDLGDGDEPERIVDIMEREGIKKRLASAQHFDKSLTVDKPGAGRKPHGIVKGR